MKICVLASGSAGNCVFVSSAQTRILIDAGLSCRETERRLQAIGETLGSIQAVCVTHEHSDHTGGLDVMRRRIGVALYANSGTAEAVERAGKMERPPWNIFTTGQAFAIGDLRVEPFTVPHDSYDPVGFAVTDGGTSASRVGIVTDIGMATELVRQRLRECRVLVIESNHDEDMLRNSERPWALKQRIAGRQGHFSNRQAGELVAAVAGPALKFVFLAHLSSECNKPAMAVHTMQDVLKKVGCAAAQVKLTHPDQVSEVVEL